MITLDLCLKYVEDKWLSMHETDDGKLVGFKYNLNTIYANHWDEVTMNCRGIVFEKSSGKIVAHPFNKFFNFQEIYAENGEYTALGNILCSLKGFEPKITKKFTAMDKIDGSLGIVFYYDNQWYVKTGGHFYSEQAIWGKKWLTKYVNTDLLHKGYTYCFEIISNEDLHVCHYDYEGLVLLGIFDENHNEFSYDDIVKEATKLNVRYSVAKTFNNIEECLEYTRTLDENHEGFVITFESGFKIKLKGDKYIERFHQVYGITRKDIRQHYDLENGCIEKEYYAAIPEECPDMKAYATMINNLSVEIYDKCKKAFEELGNLQGRERFEKANQIIEPNLVGIVMSFNKDKNIWQRIWKVIRFIIKTKDDDDDV